MIDRYVRALVWLVVVFVEAPRRSSWIGRPPPPAEHRLSSLRQLLLWIQLPPTSAALWNSQWVGWGQSV